VLATDVEEFWLDAVGRSKNTQYVGRVAIAVSVADGATGERLWGRRYVGIRRQNAEADSKTTWREVMNTALARTIRDLATDPDLALTVARTPR
jgi:tellurite resistance protein